RDYQELPGAIDLERYPPYYRRNFHWQTDGYFSRRSAELYDLSTGLLFAGTTDVMRRQVIPPISRFLLAAATGDAPTNGAIASNGGGAAPSDAAAAASRPRRACEHRLLDVGCGTGRTLAQIALAHPRLRLYGVDLSPYYVQAARDILRGVPDVS